MKKTEKLSLTELQVSSFVTNELTSKMETLKGGALQAVNFDKGLIVSNPVLNSTFDNQIIVATQLTLQNGGLDKNTIVIDSCFCQPPVGF